MEINIVTIINQIDKGNYTIKEIAECFDIEYRQMEFIFNKYKLRKYMNNKKYHADRKNFINILNSMKYYNYKDIAKYMNVCESTICKNIKKYKLKNLYEKNKLKYSDEIYNDIREVLETGEYSTYEDIGEILGYSQSTIGILINKYNLAQLYNENKDSLYNRITNVIKNGKYSSYKDISEICGTYIYNVARIIRSNNLKEEYIKNRGRNND